MKRLSLLACAMVIAGCNSYGVRPIHNEPGMTSVTVINNDRVIVPDFADVLADAFADRGIKVRWAGSAYNPAPGEYLVRYNALRSWDFVAYLSDATVRVEKDGVTIGKGHYHHIGGSLSLDVFTKWRGTKKKMEDLYDRLLKEYQKTVP